MLFLLEELAIGICTAFPGDGNITGTVQSRYRLIGTWCAGRMGKTFDSLATVQLLGSNASGSWKLHALLPPSDQCPTTSCFCLTALLIIGGVDPNSGTGSHKDDRDTSA